VRSLKSLYFLTYAVSGSVQPLLSLFLKDERGLTDAQVGEAMAIAYAAVLLTPIGLTWLADTHLEARRVIGGIFAALGIALGLLARSHELAAIVVFVAAQQLLFSPLVPLEDGLFFSAQDERHALGQKPIAYHLVRVWGTIGYIAPTVVFYVPLHFGWPLVFALEVGVAFAVLGFLTTFRLPSGQARAGMAKGIAPTLAALRTLARPRALVFCAATALGHAAVSGWQTYFPIYLGRDVGLANEWISPITNFGVLLEIVWMLALGRLERRIGFKGIMLAGCGAMVLRVLLLVASPTVPVVLATQALHGLIVLFIFVAPQLYLNGIAGEGYRSSIQGVYATLVAGVARVLGNWGAGLLAPSGTRTVFIGAAVAAAVAALLLPFAFPRRERRDPAS
jgi:MFS transporter, PPP family, 3-phenylpropionic acid transporter